MSLTNALDTVYGHNNWSNPIHPYFVSGVQPQTPFETYKKLKKEYQDIICRLIGHLPTKYKE